VNIKTLGDLIQIKRYEQRLTIEQLALKMGIAPKTIRSWQSDSERPCDRHLGQLSDILGFKLTDNLSCLVQ
jgi:transcriptional regulator with XRE-family HTH domain